MVMQFSLARCMLWLIVSWNINNLHHSEVEGIPDRTNVPIRKALIAPHADTR